MTTGKKILYGLLGLVGFVVLAVVGAAGIGMFMGREYSFSRWVQLSVPPVTVWDAVTNYPAQTSWRPDLGGYERLADRNGRETWKVSDKHDISMIMQVHEATPPYLLVLYFEDEGGSGRIRWEFLIQAADGGSRVTLQERSEFANPFYRFVGRYLFGDKFARDFLRHLAAKFGDPEEVRAEGR